MSKRPTRAVITIATGKKVYFEMALNLARSFKWWHQKSEISFYIFTDLPFALPSDLESVQLIRCRTDELGLGFSAKLKLDKLAPASRTLFIDADCLLVRNLDAVFDRFAGRPIAVVGSSISDGEWFGDIKSLLQKFSLSKIPKFNGGIYYVEKSKIADEVFFRARDLEKDYDRLGLVRLRGRPNDELLIALAMGIVGQEAVADDGSVMGDLLSCPRLLRLNVLRGISQLENPPAPASDHRSWYPHRYIEPAIVHFLGDCTRRWPYRAEAMKLRIAMAYRCPSIVAHHGVSLAFSTPQKVKESLRAALRPIYHRVFGVRPVKPSERI